MHDIAIYLKHIASQLGIDVVLVQEMYEKELISHNVVSKWQKFGFELGFSHGEMSTINKDAEDKANEDCALQMLGEWRAMPTATPKKLIAALEAIDKNRYASQLKRGIQLDKFIMTLCANYMLAHSSTVEIYKQLATYLAK